MHIASSHSYSLLVPSCDVADALLKLHIPHGGFLAGLTLWSPKRQDGPTRIVGPAYTVRYVRKDQIDEPKPSGHYVRFTMSYHLTYAF